MSFFGRWEPGHSMVLCIDTPDDFRSQLEQSIAKGEDTIDLSNPFALYVPLIDQIVDLYDRSVWGIRDLIRTVEKVPFLCWQADKMILLTAYEKHREGVTETSFSKLNEISRHATHSTETLSVTTQSLEIMQQRHRSFHESSPSPNAATQTFPETAQQHMNFQAQLIHNLKLRSCANQERLQSEITLVFLHLPM
jgi:hypothetical protein